MRRKTFDALLTTGGMLLAVVMLVAGGLLAWGHSFANNEVTSQLTAQQIFFPPAGNAAYDDPEIKPYLEKYAGQQLVTGAQAEAYANHYIAVHLKASGGGLTYAQLSTKARTEPTNTELAGQVQTMFRGETLRGLLLNAYAFWKLGQIAQVASIAAFIASGLLFLLSILGFVHLWRTGPDAEVLPALGGRPKAAAGA
jgi:hypothetical protein